MEGGRGRDSLYENLGDNYNNSQYSWLHPSKPLTSIDKFLWSHRSNFSYNQEFLYTTNHHQELSLFSSNHVFSTGGVLSHTSNSNGLLLVDEVNNNLDNSQLSPSELSKENGTHWVKGQWTLEEDRKLADLVNKYGIKKWSMIANHMAGRIGKQCRERWQNHLRPDIKKDHWSEEEEKLLIEAHERVGNKWAEIAKCIPGRTENSIKNHWNATKRKQLSKRKIRRPEALNGVKISTVLEEYIKKKVFNNRPSTSITILNSSSFSTNSTSNIPNHHPNNTPESNLLMSDIYHEEEDPVSGYLTFETYEEEMNFMTKLFGNMDDDSNNYSILNTGQVMSSSSINAPENMNSSNSSISTQMTNFWRPIEENVENDELLASFSESDMDQMGGIVDIIPQEEGGDTFSYPEIYFSSYMFEESIDLNLAMNEDTSAKIVEMDLMGGVSTYHSLTN